MKKGPPGCFGYVRDYNYTTQFCWDYENLIDHETRIPIKQPVQWKVRGVFFFVARFELVQAWSYFFMFFLVGLKGFFSIQIKGL